MPESSVKVQKKQRENARLTLSRLCLVGRGAVRACARRAAADGEEIALSEERALFIITITCLRVDLPRQGGGEEAGEEQPGEPRMSSGAAQLRGILDHVRAVLGHLGTVPGQLEANGGLK